MASFWSDPGFAGPPRGALLATDAVEAALALVAVHTRRAVLTRQPRLADVSLDAWPEGCVDREERKAQIRVVATSNPPACSILEPWLAVYHR